MATKRNNRSLTSRRPAKKARRAQAPEPEVAPDANVQQVAPVQPEPQAKPVAGVLQLGTLAASQVLRRFTLPAAPPQPEIAKSRARRGAQAQPVAQAVPEAPAQPGVAFWNIPAFWTFLAVLLTYAFYAVLAWALFQGAGSIAASVTHAVAWLQRANPRSAPAQFEAYPRLSFDDDDRSDHDLSLLRPVL